MYNNFPRERRGARKAELKHTKLKGVIRRIILFDIVLAKAERS
jgi:hypothetical protein